MPNKSKTAKGGKKVKKNIKHFIKESLSEQERISRESEKSRIIEQVKNSRDIIPEIYYLRMVEIIKTNKE